MPRLSCSSPVSISVTGIPALANDIAMPPPMVPAPMMATRSTLRGLVPSGTPAILAASRSEKKAYRCAFDWSPDTSFRKPSRSFFSPSSNGRSMAAPTASAAANGASSPRAFLVRAATALVKIERSALAAASLLSSSRSLRKGRFSASTLRAKPSPPEAGPSTISSISPFFNASVALIGSPPTIILTASSGPTARGRRCVPPAPGSRPSFTSGRPSRASLVATRKWQASATSRPPPSAVP